MVVSPARTVPGAPPVASRARRAGRAGGVLPFLLALALALALVVAAAGPGAAQDAGVAVDLDAEPVYGTVVAGTWTPVRALLSPTEPVAGRLGMTSDGDGQTIVQRDVEVAAGATEAVTGLVPPGSAASVQFDDGSQVATSSLSGDGAAAQLVGVLDDPDFRDEVGAVTDPVTGLVWTTVDVPAELLVLGPLALDALGTLVADQAALAGLDGAARTAVAAAVHHQGLHLVVTGVTSDPDVGRAPAALAGGFAPIPSAWPLAVAADEVAAATAGTADGATITSGLGRVTWLTPDVPGEALVSARTWGGLWTAVGAAPGRAGAMGDMEGSAVVDPWMFQQRGQRLPSSWGMFAVALLWLVLAGVTAILVVGRLPRRELAWVVLPALALGLSGVAAVAAGDRDVVGGREAVVAVWIDGVGMQTDVVAGSFGDDGPLLPGPGWQVRGLGWPGTGARVTPDGTRLAGTAESFGESGVTLAVRSASTPPPLVVEAARTGDTVRVEVTNDADVALGPVRVTTGGFDDAQVPRLAAGETTVVDLAPGRPEQSWLPDALVDGIANPWDEDLSRATLAGHAGDLVAAAPDLVWVRAIGEDVVEGAVGVGSRDPQVLAVAVTPTVADPTTPVPAGRLVWQENGRAAASATGLLDGGGTAWIRLGLAGPDAVGSLAVDLPGGDGDDCVNWIVWRDATGQSDVVTLCDGEQPPCVESGECVPQDGFVDTCDDRGCETWELERGGSAEVEVWDTVEQSFRPWEDDLAADVAEDPGRVVTPLGDVVVSVCCGALSFDDLQVTTGGGS